MYLLVVSCWTCHLTFSYHNSMASTPDVQSARLTEILQLDDDFSSSTDQNLEESWKRIYHNLPPTFKNYLSIMSPKETPTKDVCALSKTEIVQFHKPLTGKLRGAKRWKMIVKRVAARLARFNRRRSSSSV